MRYVIQAVAMAAMVIDHTGLIQGETLGVLRNIGRMSFPLYAYLMTTGYFRSPDKKKYLVRLLGLAILSEPLYDIMLFDLAGNPLSAIAGQNVIWTFLISGLAMYITDRKMPKACKILVWGAGAWLAAFLQTDYGAIGVCLCAGYWIVRDGKTGAWAVAAWYAGAMMFISEVIGVGSMSYFGAVGAVAVLSVNRLLEQKGIVFWDRKPCRAWKVFYHYFYPLHIVILLPDVILDYIVLAGMYIGRLAGL